MAHVGHIILADGVERGRPLTDGARLATADTTGRVMRVLVADAAADQRRRRPCTEVQEQRHREDKSNNT